MFAGVSSTTAQTPTVTVTLLLLSEPSSVETTVDVEGLGTMITDPGQLAPGAAVYLEVWCQTIESAGIATSAVDLSYNTAYLDTVAGQVVLAGQWMDVFPDRFVDDAAGFINNLGGINFEGAGVTPIWAKIGTVEFDVIGTPVSGLVFCSFFAGPGLGFGIVGQGAVPPDQVDYGCLTIGTLAGDCNADNAVGLADYAQFAACMTGPGGGVPPDCACADADNDGDVDVADFAVIKSVFDETP